MRKIFSKKENNKSYDLNDKNKILELSAIIMGCGMIAQRINSPSCLFDKKELVKDSIEFSEELLKQINQK